MRIPYLLEDFRYGFVDADGKLVIPGPFSRVRRFSEGRAVVWDDKGKCGYIDTAGKWVVPPKFDECHDYENSMAVAKVNFYDNRKGGYRGSPFSIFVPTVGDVIFPWRHGTYTEYYRFDINGKQLQKADSRAEDFNETFYAKPALPPALDKVLRGSAYQDASAVWPLQGNYPIYPVARSCKYAYTYDATCRFAFFDASGRQLTDFVYEHWSDRTPTGEFAFSAGGFSHDRLPVLRDGKFGFIDAAGKEVIPCVFDSVSGFGDKYAVVVSGKAFGIIDADGNKVIDFDRGFGEIVEFMDADGLDRIFIARRASGWGVFNMDLNREVVPFTHATDTDLAMVRLGHRSAVILERTQSDGWCLRNAQGDVLRCGFKQVESAGSGVIAVQDDTGLWGALDTNGNWLFSPRYRSKFTFYDGIALVPRKIKRAAGLPSSQLFYMDIHGVEYLAPALKALETDE